MGYRSQKEGITKLLHVQGYVESDQVFDFKTDSDTGTHRRFCLDRPEVDLAADGVEFLHTIVRPVCKYRLKIGFKLSPSASRADYDVLQQQLDVLISYLCNPTNYTAFCIKLAVTKITTDQVEDHLESILLIDVLDDITLT